MRVATVFRVSHESEGGGHTFANSLLQSLDDVRPESDHEFVYYSAVSHGDARLGLDVSEGSRGVRNRDRGMNVLRGVRDRVGRRGDLERTPFEASLEEQRIDVVWFATNFAEQRCELPFLMTIYDLEHARQPWFPEVSARGEWDSRERHYSHYVPRATRVIVPNQAGLEQVVDHFRIGPERVIRLAHPTPRFALDAAAEGPLPRDRVERLGIGPRYLLYPAQFWAHKNHATLLEAVAELASDDREPYELVLVGSDQGQLAHVRDLARAAGVTQRVHFLGFVNTDDLVALYQHAHALVYLSFFGPENLPPLEAFALGCPVVAADVPGTQEQLGDAALLVPPTDAARTAEAVRRLEEPSLRAELVERGRGRAESRSADSYVRGVFGFLDDFERVRRNWS